LAVVLNINIAHVFFASFFIALRYVRAAIDFHGGLHQSRVKLQ